MVLLFFTEWTLACLLLLAWVLGATDDICNLKPIKKIIPELLIASFLIMFGYRLHWTQNVCMDVGLTIFWIVGMMNALNLSDNMDGLAAGLGIIAGGFFYSITGDVLALMLCGALAGFLLFNYQPASIYMGDSGSLLVGLILALLPMRSSVSIAPVVTMLILAVPLFDTSMVTVTRAFRKRPPWKGGRDHVSHLLARQLFGKRQAVIFLYFVAAICGIGGMSIHG